MELEAEYTVADGWDLVGRLPFDIKRQTASVSLVAPATEQEREAMLRNMNLHHRSETYSSLSDAMLLAAHRRYNLWRSGDALKVALGATLPAGRTEPDPYQLGAAGRQHLHIQFGTGTIDPLLELNYRTPLRGAASVGGFLLGRSPLYENARTYRGPSEITAGLTAGYRLNGRLSIHGNVIHYYQGYARWGGARDENSGLQATSGMLGVTLRIAEQVHLGVDVRQPFSQRALLPEGDAFEQGPTFMLRVARASRSTSGQ